VPLACSLSCGRRRCHRSGRRSAVRSRPGLRSWPARGTPWPLTEIRGFGARPLAPWSG